MVDPEDVPLILLYTDSRSAIQGTTRLQKYVFLAQEEENLAEFFEFNPYKYGPYSGELRATLHSLADRGLIDTTTETTAFGNERHIYSITTRGIQRVQELLKGAGAEDIFESLQEVKRRYKEWGDRRLLRYVYDRHGDYATETELSEADLRDPHAEFDSIPEEVPVTAAEIEDEPAWLTEAAEVDPDDSFPAAVEYYLDRIREIPLVAEVYLQEMEDEPDEIVSVLEQRDYDVMDELYDVELELMDGFPDREIKFRVTVKEAIDPVVSTRSRQVYSRE